MDNFYDAEVRFKSEKYVAEFDVHVWLTQLIESHNLPEGMSLERVSVTIDYSVGEEE